MTSIRRPRNLLRAIEQGTDPTVVQPRIADLRDDRVALVSDLATIDSPDGRLTSDDIAALLDELGGMETVLAEAGPRDKAAIYASLGLRLEYQPDQRAFSQPLTLAVYLVVSEDRVSR